MTEIILYTCETRYRGSLGLTTASGERIRFLDALNHPQRFGLRSLTASPRLRLQRATREGLTSDVSETLCEELTVRLERVVLGFEEVPLGSPAKVPAAPATAYETRVSPPPERIVMDLENGISLEATVRGGTRTLKRAKLGCNFVACRDVLMSDPLYRLGLRRAPFVAVNVLRIESYGRMQETGARPWVPRRLRW